MRLGVGFSDLLKPTQRSASQELDARAKLLWLAATIILSLALQTIPCLFVLFCSTLIYSSISKLLRRHIVVLKVAFLLSLLSTLLMLTITTNPHHLLDIALHLFIRLGVVTSAGILFTFTTSPRSLIAGLERLRIPRTLTFPLTIAIRFVPSLLKEIREIKDSLRLRGMKPGWSLFIRHPVLWYRGIFMPLTIRSITISDELTAASESRGFGNPGKRTSLREGNFKLGDGAFISTVCFVSVALFSADYYLRSIL